MRADALLEKAVRMASLELQRSGYMPSAGEAQIIKESTAQLQEELSKIDAEIRRLAELRVQILQQCEVQESIVAPVRRLPPETLSEIFLELVDDENWASDSVFVVRHVLSCVCASWRAVARSTPALWNKIPTQLHSELRYPEWCAYWKHATENALLAGGQPLELHHQDDTRDELLHRIIEEMGPHLTRVESIRVQGRFSLFEALRNTSLPALRNVFMEMRGRPTTHPMHFLTGSPALQSLDVQYFNEQDYLWLDSLHIPTLPSLTSLSLEMHAIISRTAFLQALDVCADTLVRLTLRLTLDGDAPTTLIHMPALHTLSLGDSAFEILDILVTPALHYIAFPAVIAPLDGDPFPTLCAFLSSPSRPRGLEEFSVAVSINQPATFIQCLEQMEELTYLSIHGAAFPGLTNEDVFSRLTCTKDDVPLLPRLTSLRISLPPPARRSAQAEIALQELLASRSVPRICASHEVPALEEVYVSLGD